jgi:hypothetical protein
VKAAYLHKFAGYVDWPPSAFPDAQAPIVLGVAGSERIYAELARVALGRPVQGRPVSVRRVTQPDQVNLCHVLFVSRELWKDPGPWLAAARDRPVALVTDAQRGTETGAILTFVEVQNRVRFEASLPAAERAGLKLSARLLAVAEKVAGP